MSDVRYDVKSNYLDMKIVNGYYVDGKYGLFLSFRNKKVQYYEF